jgi:hypothetical protein
MRYSGFERLHNNKRKGEFRSNPWRRKLSGNNPIDVGAKRGN